MINVRFCVWLTVMFAGGLLLPNISRAQQLTHTCKFTKGPRAGESISFWAATPIPVGSFCTDGVSSTGTAISENPHPPSVTHTCQFDQGPRAGKTITFTAAPLGPIGSFCADGFGSSGLTVPENAHPQLTHTCEFDQGPRSGQKQVYPQAMPVGASCWDGRSSGGVTVPDGTSSTPAPVLAAGSTNPPGNTTSGESSTRVRAPAQNAPRQTNPERPSSENSGSTGQPEVSGPDSSAGPQGGGNVVQAQQIAPAERAVALSPSLLASFQRAPFANPAWMKALYSEDFPVLNNHRISALSYVAGILAVENSDNGDTSCPRMSQDITGTRLSDDMLGAVLGFNEHLLTTVYGIGAVALLNGREYRPNAKSAVRMSFDMAGLNPRNLTGANLMSNPPRVALGVGSNNTRLEFAHAGAVDANYLLAHFGGCSSALFKRVYSGIEGFVLREAPRFRPANGTPALQIKVVSYKHWFSSEQMGKLDYEYHIDFLNHAQLPQELNIMQSWTTDSTYAPPDVAPVDLELFSSDGRPLDENQPDAPFRASTLNDLVFRFRAPADHRPPRVYLEIYDARHDKVYLSNLAVVPNSLPAPPPAPAIQMQRRRSAVKH